MLNLYSYRGVNPLLPILYPNNLASASKRQGTSLLSTQTQYMIRVSEPSQHRRRFQ